MSVKPVHLLAHIRARGLHGGLLEDTILQSSRIIGQLSHTLGESNADRARLGVRFRATLSGQIRDAGQKSIQHRGQARALVLSRGLQTVERPADIDGDGSLQPGLIVSGVFDIRLDDALESQNPVGARGLGALLYHGARGG